MLVVLVVLVFVVLGVLFEFVMSLFQVVVHGVQRFH